VVLKVGGSLYELPDLGPRLRAWLRELGEPDVLLVPGGGPAADVVRDLDRRHALGEETSHWLALRALSVTAGFLQALLPGSALLTTLHDGAVRGLQVLDPYTFARADEGRPGCLPHTWQATSDAVAARAAVVAGAAQLILLKSVPIPAGMSWREAARRELVDSTFPGVVEQAPNLAVQMVDFNGWRAGTAKFPPPT
jgi:aspartokinase-like uncharacterized kinase